MNTSCMEKWTNSYIFLANHRYVPATSEFTQCIFFLQWCPSGSSPHWGGFMITRSDTSQSLGILWSSDQPDAEIST